MITKFILNALSGAFDKVSVVPQLDSDPASPNTEDMWVLKTSSGGSGGGTIKGFLGLGFPYLSPSSGGSTTYQLSYRTLEGTTKRVTLS